MDAIFGDRFYGTREPGWHKLGQVFKKALKPSVAVRKIGLDYEVGLFPMTADVGRKHIETGRKAIMRSPTKDDPEWRFFGTAAGKYEVIQNTDLATILDPLAELWELNAMGAIDKGKTVFMVLNTGGVDVVGDPINGYFVLTDTKDGGTAHKLIFTPVRVVCKNTLTTGLRAATVSINVHHLAGARDELAARVSLIKSARAAIDETTEVFRKMAKAKMTKTQVEDMMTQVYPLPEAPDDAAYVDWTEEDLGTVLFKGVADRMYNFSYYTKVAQDQQAGAMTLFEKLNDEYPKLAGTAWHAYNSVVELADWREGGKNPEASAMFGARSREKVRGFKAAMAYVK